MEPAARDLVEAVLLREVGIVRGDLDVDRLGAFAFELGDHDFRQPQEALLVGGQHAHARILRAGLCELVSRLIGDPLADLRRFAEARLQFDRRAGLHFRQDVALELRPELVDLPGHVDLVFEYGHRIGDALTRRRHSADAFHPVFDARGEPLVEAGIRLLEVHLRVK